MVNKFIKHSRKILSSPQNSIFSAAGVIMFMIIVSKVLGFIRQRVLFSYFPPEVTDIYLAAFELPDLMFEVFVTGILSAAFIPVLSKHLNKKGKKAAWETVNASLSLLLAIFLVFSLIIFVFAGPIYHFLAGANFKNAVGLVGGFSEAQISQIIVLARVLIAGQFFFLVSTLFTGILESQKRFLIPAVAPLFYNLGIIISTLLFSTKIGLLAPTLGAVIGAFFHFLIQLPFVLDLGYRPRIIWRPKDEGVLELVKLAAPRVLEISLFQIRRFVWLFLSSTVAGGLTYLRSADLLQSLPVGVFGISLAKAAFPNLSREYALNQMHEFRQTFYSTLNQILYFVVPLSVFMIVLRIPIVRLVFGAEHFSWSDTIQTGQVLSAFSLGVFAYAASLILSRGFYALHDTKTPVFISAFSVTLNATLGFLFIVGLKLDTWGIALSFSISGIFQFLAMFSVFMRRIHGESMKILLPLFKMVFAASVASGIMFFIFKIFDRSVWVKRLSFLGSLDIATHINFERFVIDTRYTFNLVVLTTIVFAIGCTVYFVLTLLLKTQEAQNAQKMIPRFLGPLSPRSNGKEGEQVSPPPSDISVN